MGRQAVTPRVSVIVPVRDRRALLRELLDALAAQTLTDHEVIVVDDGSTDGSAEEAEADPSRGRPVRVVRTTGSGAVPARRVGVDEAAADILAFTDSDCVPEPGWLAAGVAAIDAGADLAQGITHPARGMRPLERSVAVGREDGLYATCNLFYRRGAYERAGGFDAALGRRVGFRPGRTLRGTGFGEDALLGWRVRRAGRTAFVPEAVVRHHVFGVDVRESVRRTWAVGAFPALVREIPELRDSLLVDRTFLQHRERVGLYAAATAFAFGRRRAATMAAAAWALRRTARVIAAEPLASRRLKVVPVDLALDAIRAVALVTGSVRARTLVL